MLVGRRLTVNCTLRHASLLICRKCFSHWVVCSYGGVGWTHKKRREKKKKVHSHTAAASVSQWQNQYRSNSSIQSLCVCLSPCVRCVSTTIERSVCAYMNSHSLLQQFVKLCINVHDNAATTASAAAAAATMLLKFYIVVLICSVALNKSMRTAPSRTVDVFHHYNLRCTFFSLLYHFAFICNTFGTNTSNNIKCTL